MGLRSGIIGSAFVYTKNGIHAFCNDIGHDSESVTQKM